MALVIEAAQETDIPALFALLQQSSLPTDGLRDHLSTVLVARENRGVAVVATERDQELGERLTRAALELAQARGITEVYLLTETAQHYFPRFGFHAIPRQAVAPAIHQSVEWTSACPETAQAMYIKMAERAQELFHAGSNGEAARVPR
jgi:amino-acid N-acetyltransferase